MTGLSARIRGIAGTAPSERAAMVAAGASRVVRAAAAAAGRGFRICVSLAFLLPTGLADGLAVGRALRPRYGRLAARFAPAASGRGRWVPRSPALGARDSAGRCKRSRSEHARAAGVAEM